MPFYFKRTNFVFKKKQKQGVARECRWGGRTPHSTMWRKTDKTLVSNWEEGRACFAFCQFPCCTESTDVSIIYRLTWSSQCAVYLDPTIGKTMGLNQCQAPLSLGLGEGQLERRQQDSVQGLARRPDFYNILPPTALGLRPRCPFSLMYLFVWPWRQ